VVVGCWGGSVQETAGAACRLCERFLLLPGQQTPGFDSLVCEGALACEGMPATVGRWWACVQLKTTTLELFGAESECVAWLWLWLG
jgi:hypothetical protein